MERGESALSREPPRRGEVAPKQERAPGPQPAERVVERVVRDGRLHGRGGKASGAYARAGWSWTNGNKIRRLGYGSSAAPPRRWGLTFLRPMPLAITTPTGHIGSALVRRLLDADRDTAGGGRRSQPRPPAPRRLEARRRRPRRRRDARGRAPGRRLRPRCDRGGRRPVLAEPPTTGRRTACSGGTRRSAARPRAPSRRTESGTSSTSRPRARRTATGTAPSAGSAGSRTLSTRPTPPSATSARGSSSRTSRPRSRPSRTPAPSFSPCRPRPRPA